MLKLNLGVRGARLAKKYACDQHYFLLTPSRCLSSPSTQFWPKYLQFDLWAINNTTTNPCHIIFSIIDLYVFFIILFLLCWCDYFVHLGFFYSISLTETASDGENVQQNLCIKSRKKAIWFFFTKKENSENQRKQSME